MDLRWAAKTGRTQIVQLCWSMARIMIGGSATTILGHGSIRILVVPKFVYSYSS
jgi:hypothetical protein